MLLAALLISALGAARFLQQRMVAVPAQVTSKIERVEDFCGSYRRSVGISFVPLDLSPADRYLHNGAFVASLVVDEASYDRLQIGDGIVVRYLPSWPALVVPDDPWPLFRSLWPTLLALTFFVVALTRIGRPGVLPLLAFATIMLAPFPQRCLLGTDPKAALVFAATVLLVPPLTARLARPGTLRAVLLALLTIPVWSLGMLLAYGMPAWRDNTPPHTTTGRVVAVDLRAMTGEGEDMLKPYLQVQVEFVPEGRRDAVVAADYVDASAAQHLDVGSAVELHYRPRQPRTVEIIGVARSFRWQNGLRELFLAGLLLAAWLYAGRRARGDLL